MDYITQFMNDNNIEVDESFNIQEKGDRIYSFKNAKSLWLSSGETRCSSTLILLLRGEYKIQKKH